MKYSKAVFILSLAATFNSSMALADYNSDVTRLLKESASKDASSATSTADAAGGTGTVGLFSGMIAMVSGKEAAPLLLSGLGLSALGGISWAAGQIWHRNDDNDAVKLFKKTPTYRSLYSTFGVDTADGIALDIYSGYSIDRVLQKYTTTPAHHAALEKVLTQDVIVQNEIPAVSPAQDKPGTPGTSTMSVAPQGVAPGAR